MKTDNESLHYEEKEMNGIATGTDLNDIVALRGVGGVAGVGGWGGWGGVQAPYANLASLQHGQDYNRQHCENQQDCTREVLSTDIDGVRQSFENLTRDNQFASITKTVSDCNSAVNKNITDSEFRNTDRFRDIEREMNANARVADKCCCDTQKAIAEAAKEAAKCCCETNLKMSEGFAATALKAAENQAALLLKMCEDKNELSKQMAEGFAGIKDRELNAANAKITQLETINALQNNHHPHH